VLPTQLPAFEASVTIYCTEPAAVLLGLFNTWLIVDPEPGVAPVIPPVTFPIVHAKLLGAVAVRLMFVFPPLHMVTAAGVVTTGVGLTVTVIVYGEPGQFPVDDVGVTIY
jgi:hypothetical protein